MHMHVIVFPILGKTNNISYIIVMVMIKKNGVKDKRVAVPFDSCLSSAVNLPG